MFTERQRTAGLPAEVIASLVRIQDAVDSGRPDEAERMLTTALARVPRHPETLRFAAVLAALRGRPDQAIEMLLQARTQHPEDPLIYLTMGEVYLRLNDTDNAIKALRHACNTGPELPIAWFNFGAALSQSGFNEHAAAALRQTLKLDPQHQGARTLLAHGLNAEGKSHEAAAEFRRILASNPGNGSAWWGLATLKPMPLGKDDLTEIDQALRNPTKPEAGMVLEFARAHLLEHLEKFSAAFAAFEKAHAIARELNAVSPQLRDSFDQHAGELTATYAKDGAGEQGREAIFIVSMPRSGSTLVEQVLASHAQVQGTTELKDLIQIMIDESDQRQMPFLNWAPLCSVEHWLELGRRYLQRTERWRRERPRFTDKMPENWRYIGAILAMLPQARIVVVRRDPLETCFACYRMLFQGREYTHDFAKLAETWRSFDESTRFWQARHPDRVRIQSYEELVKDPETQIRLLLEFCDLPFEPACLNFHETKRRVTTLSAGQVRQPIRRDTARADKYGALLDPLRKELGLPPFVA
jgi:tetratricopeptide (TPR) repeat protein